MQFNEKLKQLRSKKGISQAELAEKIFVSRSAVAKWENGLGLPSDQSLCLLAEFFGVETSALLSDPTTESAIISKNSTISKQKIWIISLSVFALIAILGLICNYFISRSTKPIAPIISRQLIFETEKELETDIFVNYPDDEISADNTFEDSRTFEIKRSIEAFRLPELLVRITVNGNVTYESVDYSSLIFTCSENILLTKEHDQEKGDYISVFYTEYHAIEFSECANIKYGDLFVSVKLFRNHVPVESVSIGLIDDSSQIGLTQTKELVSDITPFDADYTKCRYSIQKIIAPDGEEYIGNLAEYAYIEGRYLTATKNLQIGSVIYVVAITEYDNVKSNVFAVTVDRIGVERITFYVMPGQYYVVSSKDIIEIGEQISLELKCYPVNCSFNVLEEQAVVTLLTPELATLEKTESGWLMTATSNIRAVGEKICIKVETPEGVSETFYWLICGIPIESITLINDDTDEELDQITYISRNGTLRLRALVAPTNATYEKINYGIYVDMNNFGIYVKMSDDGILTISDDAPFDMEIFVSASVGRIRSRAYKIIVKQVPLDSLTLKCETATVHIDEIISLTIDYSPFNADILSRMIIIIDEIEGVYISGNRIYVSPRAAVGAQFRVKAVVNGIESNIITFTIKDKEE